MTRSQPPTGNTAIVAKRADRAPVDPTEITALTTAAGYRVVEAITQARTEDPGTYLGSGKLDELAERVRTTDADLVVIDDELTPGQYRNITERLPSTTRLTDRIRLVLEIFAEQAPTKRARLQVERVQLEYDLAVYEADADEGWFNRRSEKGSPRYDLQDRIARLERELASMADPADHLRKRRREQGFDLVTIAGYTNAGKSTLLHRLADDLDVATAEASHPDDDPVAAAEDRLFKTLETTTRRATFRRRPVLCTDTVGYIADLPHDLVAAFSSTLSEAAAADVVILLADATDEADAFVEKLEVSIDVLEGQGVDIDDVVLAINKADAVDIRAVAALQRLANEYVDDPLAISAKDGTNVDDLIDAVVERLPTDRRSVVLPYDDDAMRLVSTAYDRLVVHDVEYADGTVTLDVEGRPDFLDARFADASTVTTNAS